MMFIHNVFFVHKVLARARQSFKKMLSRPRLFNGLKKMGRVGGRVVVVDINNYVPEWKTVLNNYVSRVDDCLN